MLEPSAETASLTVSGPLSTSWYRSSSASMPGGRACARSEADACSLAVSAPGSAVRPSAIGLSALEAPALQPTPITKMERYVHVEPRDFHVPRRRNEVFMVWG